MQIVQIHFQEAALALNRLFKNKNIASHYA